MIAVIVVENMRNAEIVADIVVPELELELPEEPGVGVPDPPAAADNWANPTEAGVARNTEYTFFRNVSPTTQLGLPEPAGILTP